MKKITTFALMAFAFMLILSSCSGSDKSMLFGSLPSKYSELKSQRDQLEEKAKNVKTEEEKAEIIKKSQKLDEKWTPRIEKAATKLDGKEIDITDDTFKVTSPISLTFEKLSSRTLEPIFKINGSAETAEAITLENTINPSLLVYIAGYDAEGNKLYSIKVGRITGEVEGTTVTIPAGTPIDFSNLTFAGAYVDKYPETKTLKFIYS